MPATRTESFRPAFGRWLTIGFAIVCAVAAIASLFSDGWGAIVNLWPWLALLVGACWAVFWHPQVRVDDQGVVVVNVSHTVEIPWAALIGLETKWALTVVTVDRRYRAWAAPAPGRTAMRTEHSNTHRLSDAAVGGEIRPGDLPETDSGAAALMVRRFWKTQIEMGALDEAEAATAQVRLRWHRSQFVVALVLMLLAAVGLS